MTQPPILLRDPIWGTIRLDPLALEVVDTAVFQRLRYVKQLGLTYLVYPGATHKRFEHSLGVMELATRVYEVITSPHNIHHELIRTLVADQSDYWHWLRTLRMAALCHDIGHLPFSHAAEDELLPPHGVPLPVHHREPQDGGAVREHHVFDVEVLVVVHIGRADPCWYLAAAEQVALPAGAGGGVLVERERIERREVLAEAVELAVDVLARQDDVADPVGQRLDGRERVIPGVGARVDQHLRAGVAEHGAEPVRVAAVEVRVGDLGEVVTLGLAAVHDGDLVAGLDEILEDGGADEPGPAQERDAHGARA
jgi:hypothetical protein